MATGLAVTAGLEQCDARRRTRTRTHAIGDRCPKLARFVLTAGEAAMLVCRHCARLIGQSLARRGACYTLTEIRGVKRRRKRRMEVG